ncbi:hypothetical protein FHS45_000591 [Thalassobacillus devorans]|nr:hypothetical protein [Thalassobacillus devorans]
MNVENAGIMARMVSMKLAKYIEIFYLFCMTPLIFRLNYFFTG